MSKLRHPHGHTRRLIEAARDLGFVVHVGGSGHLRFEHPHTGRAVTASATPRCPYAYQHALRDLRKAAS